MAKEATSQEIKEAIDKYNNQVSDYFSDDKFKASINSLSEGLGSFSETWNTEGGNITIKNIQTLNEELENVCEDLNKCFIHIHGWKISYMTYVAKNQTIPIPPTGGNQ